jgi:hypothetical protein
MKITEIFFLFDVADYGDGKNRFISPAVDALILAAKFQA